MSQPSPPPDEPADPPLITPADPPLITPADSPADIPAASSARHRLALMARPRATKANAFAALLAILLGFAVATQVRQNEQGLETLRQGELVAILDNATLLSARLDQNARQLQVTRDQLVSGSTGEAAALKVAQERLDALAILAGTARARGPGIRMSIVDSQAKVEATFLLDAIEELRNAGAEAIQVGNVRVVANSYFGGVPGNLSIDGIPISSPYTILAIGDPAMARAMEIQGGVSANIRGLAGASITITQSRALIVGALHTLREARYARPVPSPAPNGAP